MYSLNRELTLMCFLCVGADRITDVLTRRLVREYSLHCYTYYTIQDSLVVRLQIAGVL